MRVQSISFSIFSTQTLISTAFTPLALREIRTQQAYAPSLCRTLQNTKDPNFHHYFVRSLSTLIFMSNPDSFSGTTSSAHMESESVNFFDKSHNPRDSLYPGTSTIRLKNIHQRISQLTTNDLNGEWEDVRRKLLWAGGLRDLPNALPGQGYTGHAFNDYNHVDLTPMLEDVSFNQNDGSIQEIAKGNLLGPGIRIASDPTLGPGGSWSTCANGCHLDPPLDVAHTQFRSRIAFKLVWVPSELFNTFVLVDDDGNELARGAPKGRLPPLSHRQMNFRLVSGSKYCRVAIMIASEHK